MQYDLFGELVKDPKNNDQDIGLVLSKTMSNKSKEKGDFQKALAKNRQLQLKLEYVKNLSLFSVEKIHEILAEFDKKVG
jgi:hypothetical protein